MPFNPSDGPLVVPVEQLRDVFSAGWSAAIQVREATGEIKAVSFIEAMTVRATALKSKDPVSLLMRSSMMMDLCFTPEQQQRLQANGLWIKREREHPLPDEVVEAMAKARVEVAKELAKGTLRDGVPMFNAQPVVKLALKIRESRRRADHGAGPAADPNAPRGPLPACESNRGFPPYTPNLSDFPEYVAFLEAREQLLLALPAEHRQVYTASPFEESHPERFRAGTLAVGFYLDRRPDRRTIQFALDIGPHCLYPKLNDAEGWNFDRYKQIALGSEEGASVPCLRGLMPAVYIAELGTVAEFARCLDLCPDAVHIFDARGAPLLWHLMGSPSAAHKARIALDRGADPNSFTAAGSSLFAEALRHGSISIATLLMETGYRPSEDLSLDRIHVDMGLEHRNASPALKAFLNKLRPDLPWQGDHTRNLNLLKNPIHEDLKTATEAYVAGLPMKAAP